MSKFKKRACVAFLILYIIILLIQSITIVYTVDWSAIAQTELNGDLLRIEFWAMGSAMFLSHYEVRTVGDCAYIKLYHYRSPLFRWFSPNDFYMTVNVEDVSSVKFIDNNGGEINIPIATIGIYDGYYQ